ncbi:hypothetical protein T440DRAFT_480444 [Plenodomus tracheiphilus IPT5]|uniref:Uncharacterized protein n=1 Tax=Plenodomus tracheiphilus IPT5 TaxID=1408161 RepID=A0A6A7B3E8_9PLEO|nr:hypothetical protein T440DRAFT_480444 [Plenodomus tracheiphilus IPT5]
MCFIFRDVYQIWKIDLGDWHHKKSATEFGKRNAGPTTRRQQVSSLGKLRGSQDDNNAEYGARLRVRGQDDQAGDRREIHDKVLAAITTRNSLLTGNVGPSGPAPNGPDLDSQAIPRLFPRIDVTISGSSVRLKYRGHKSASAHAHYALSSESTPATCCTSSA